MRKMSMKIFDKWLDRLTEWMRSCVLLCPLQMLVFLFLISCGSAKVGVESEKRNEKENDIVEKVEVSGQREVDELNREDEEVEIVETVTEYSEPDFVGNQYPKKKTERKVVKKKGSQTAKKVVEGVSGEKEKNDKSKERTAEKSDVKTEVKESSWPFWIFGVAVIVFLGFIIRKLKK